MSKTLKHTDYRALLRDELAARCHANPRYSQRAFARDLRLRPNRLSEVLNGKQGLSRAVAATVAQRLGLSPRENDHFCDLVDSLHARSPARRTLASVRIRSSVENGAANRLADDVFQVIADWHHLAILELTTVRGFKSDARWLGSTLGVPEAVATAAVERLLSLGLLRREAGGRLVAASDVDLAPGGTPSAAVRHFHEQVLVKAQRALYTQGVDEREMTTAFVGLRRDRLPEAKRALLDFAASFCARYGDAPADDVYSLGLQLFRLTETTGTTDTTDGDNHT